MKEFPKALVIAITSVVLGWVLGIWSERRRFRREPLAHFIAKVDALTDELAARVDTIDSSFIGWWRKSIRTLEPHVQLLREAEPRIWRKIESAWKAYAQPAQEMTVDLLVAERINRTELISRLNRLRTAARKA